MRTTRNTGDAWLVRPWMSAMAIILGLSCTAFGQTTRYVDDDTCPNSGAGSLVDPYCGIQVAIDASIDGDTVEVSPGTYFESINFNGKAITLRSSDGAATTIIDASNVPDLGDGVSVVRCVSGETTATVLDGFTITGGTGDTTGFSSSKGGGMYNKDSSPTVINCLFDNNTAIRGGGMHNDGSSPTVIRCTYSNNTTGNRLGAGAGGGGMYNGNSSNPTVTNCTFSRNTTQSRGGGGMYNKNSSPIITNCLFVGNTGESHGGGMWNVNSNLQIINCTFSGNTADQGGGMVNFSSSNPTITNCILWGDSPDEILNLNRSSPIFSYCDVSDSGGSITWDSSLGTDGGGNVDVAPLFVNRLGLDGLIGTADDDLRLMLGSPAINTGNDAAIPDDITSDLDGLPRVVCNRVDMGAYEHHTPLLPVHNITTNKYYCTIQECIESAANSSECVVPPGTYLEALDFLGKSITVRSLNGPASTIINAMGVPDMGSGVSAVRCINGETTATVLDGFTISGGTGDTTNFGFPVGGGMFIDDSSPTVTNCTFIDNMADLGGGLFNYASNPMVINCKFIENIAIFDGGGIYNFSAISPRITNCTFIGNTGNFGGGMYNNFSLSPTVINCSFSNNNASAGGAIFNSFSSPTVTNCILWNDTADEIFNVNSSSPTISFSDLEGSGGSVAWNPLLGMDGGGNIDTNPLFVDPLGLDGVGGTNDDDLHLMLGSPAINIGNDAAIPDGITSDLDGLPRVVCNRVDMGAYEHQTPPLPVHNITTNTYYCTIQECIDAAADKEECVVSPGTYFEAIDFLGKAITVRSLNGPAATIIDATGVLDLGNGITVVRCINGETAATVLDGFTITGGTGDTSLYGNLSGGGMLIVGSNPTVKNCAFSGNTVEFGGGMLLKMSNPTVSNCTFSGNTAEFSGGGMYNEASSPTVSGCTFNNNTATLSAGGGMINFNSSNPIVNNCIFNGNAAKFGGGGIANNHSSPTVINCIFSGNTATMSGGRGGGMSNNMYSNPTLTDCTFSENTSGIGGGIMNSSDSCPTLTGCVFSGNTAGAGGGMVIDHGARQDFCSVTLTDCTFIENNANVQGGGIYGGRQANLTLIDCTFSGNSANEDGGGIYNSADTNMTATGCIFSGNTSLLFGGGIFDDGYEQTLINCSFQGNAAGLDGGGIFSVGSSLTITECNFNDNRTERNGGGIFNLGSGVWMINSSFIGNSAQVSGGGIFSQFPFRSRVTNCAFVGNSAMVDGGGMYNEGASFKMKNCSFSSNTASSGGGIYHLNSSRGATLTNCIMWGDSPDEIVIDNSPMLIAFSDIEGSGGSTAWNSSLGDDGGGNLDADPLFVDPLGADGVAGTDDDDLRLMADSPCVDAADYDAYLSAGGGLVDLDGKDRVIDNIDVVDTGVGVLTYLDMGAYEEGECHSDGIIDLGDAPNLVECLSGPASGANFGCVCVDLDADEHVDLRDFAMLQLNFNP